MSDSVILKRLPPPPRPPSKIQRHRRKQRNMILSVVAALVTGGIGWGLWTWVGSAEARAADHVQTGILLSAPGSYPQAIEEFNQALAIDPDSWEAYFRRALAFKNTGDLRSASEDFQAALDRKRDLVEALTSLAAIHRDSGEKERAINELTRAIALEPTPDAYYQRATTYQRLGQHEKAIADLTWVIDAIRDAPYVYFARANSKRALGDEDGARQDEATAYSFDRSSTLK